MIGEPVNRFRIGIIEDDPWYNQLLYHQLNTEMGFQVNAYDTAQKFFQQELTAPDLVTMDYSLPDISGEQLLKRLLATFPGLPVIVISGQRDIATAVQLIHLGATDYLAKDEYTKDLLLTRIQHAFEKDRLQQQITQLQQQLTDRHSFRAMLLGNS
ncbi:response regulator, partial [Hymenobacter rigui]